MAEELGTHLGLPIKEAGLIIRRTGDGLGKMMRIDPRKLLPGQKYYLLIECDFAGHDMDILTNDDGEQDSWKLQNVVNAGIVTFLTPDLATGAIDEQRTLNEELAEQDKLAKELAKGTRRLPTAEALSDEHRQGFHSDEAVDGCPMCEEQLAAEAEYAAGHQADVTDIASRGTTKKASKPRAKAKPKE